MVLDLAGGFAELRNAALTQLGGDLTVELWVRPWPLSGTILAYDGRRRFSLAVSPGSARVLVVLDGASFESRATLPEQEWTHLALLVRGRTARLYVDGHLDATASVSEPVGTASDHLVLGAQTSGERAGRFSGQLADLIVVGFALRTLRGLSRDLVGAWTLAGNTASARPGSDLISQGSPRFVVGHPETASRRVLQLDGASWLSAPAVRGLADVDSELTLEAWVRPDPAQSWPTIFGNDWRRSLWLGLTPGDYRLRFRINGGIYESRTGIAAAAWSHVAASTDGRSVRLWIGGRLDAVHPALVGPVLSNARSEFSIGADAGDYPFRGAIADVRIWRKAPSAPRRVLPSHHPLVAEWALAGDTRETARGNESRVIGSASFERGHPLDPTRSVLVLDGSSFVEAARPSSLVEVATEITLDAWVRPAGHADFQTIVGHEWTRGFWFGLTADGHARLWINGQNYMSRRRLSNGVWSRVTASYDGGEVRLYLQDELPDSTFAAPLGVVSVDDGPLRIGADRGSSPAGFAYPFRGALADVRIFARALDPAACDRIAATPMPQVAVLDNNVPLGRFRWRTTPVDGFGRLGAEARSENLTVEDTDPPSPPSAVRAQFRSFTGIIASVAAPSEFAPDVTLVTDILLPGDARVRDRILGGIVSYDATIEGTIGGRRREESILIVSATATTDNRLVLDVELPPLARLRPEIGQAILIDYDARLEVRWAWTGSQRVNAPDVSTFRIYDRQGAVDVIEATVGEVITDATNPDLFSVRTELASVPRRIEPSEWSGRSCLIASHRYRIESVERRGTVIEFSLRYLARPVHAPESGSRLVFAIELASNERDDPARWEGRRTTVSAGGRVPLPEHFENLNLTTLSEEAYTVVSAELAEGTPRRERLMMAELPPGATAPQPDEPAGALLGFSMDELDWGWRLFCVIGARAESGRTRLYLLRPADRSPARDLVLRRAQHFRGAWLTETLDMTVDIPPDRGTQPCEVAVSALDGDPGDAPEARRNESALSSVARAIAVDRRRPPRQPAPHVTFDAADFFGDSRATVDWLPVPHAHFEVHRAIDSDVFARDLEQRRWRRGSYSPELLPEPSAVFDDDPDFDAWLAARFPGWAARSLADLFVPKPAPDADATVWNAATEVWRAWANRFYPALFDRDVTALAELPGNEAAFACVTQAPVKGTRHVDLVRGLADNRFLYRLRTRSASFAASDLSRVSAALPTPRIRPPRTPVFTRIEAGDRSIRLDWALSREPNLASYRLYRASTAEELEDLRWSREGHDPRLIKEIDDPLIRVRGGEIGLRGETEVVSIVGVYRLDEFDASRSPELQAAFNYTSETTTHAAGVIRGLRRIADGVPVALVVRATDDTVSLITRRSERPPFVDTHVVALRDYFYRLQAVDRFGNVSTGSKTLVARATDLSPAPPPVWDRAAWATPPDDTPFVRLEWSVTGEGTRCIVQRRSEREATWRAVGDWIEAPASIAETMRFSSDD
ncbi:MAG TPA: LamG domain-containing protein, partial [Casimicrobiaceae bacterium]|nr:LamG domain-containing protein [Casimicrobiaceae bacterium]